MAGTLTISTLSDGTNSTSSTNCIQGSAKAWINYNGTATTIKGSFNVSSVTRNSAGNYTVNMTNAMPNTNYAVVVGSDYQATLGTHSANRIKTSATPLTTSSFGMYTEDQYFTTPYDIEVICASVLSS